MFFFGLVLAPYMCGMIVITSFPLGSCTLNETSSRNYVSYDFGGIKAVLSLVLLLLI